MKYSYRLFLVVAGLLAGTIGGRSEQVLISEIMYNPPGILPEYIEVYNNTATPFDMAQWKLRGGVDYDFPEFAAGNPNLTFLKPFERIVLSPVPEATLRAAYGIGAGIRIYGPWTGSLDNAGERVTLRDKNGIALCTVQYNDRGKWSPAADGAGHSLVLKNPDRRIDDWRNWTASSRRLGTPGSEPVAQAETPAGNPEVNLATGIPYVNYGDEWRFNDSATDLGTAWILPAYNDSSWKNGPGLFGFETASIPSPGIRSPMVDSDQLTYYLRTKFNYNGSLQNVTITIDQILDDGAIYYLNGQEIGRSGMPAGSGFNLAASRTVGDATEELAVISTSGAALVNGENVLAVEVHQTNPTSSDVVFGARLSISVPTQPSLVINEVLPGSAGIGFVEFYNPGGSAINLRNHYLTDDPGNLQKFRVNSDIIIPAGGLGSIGFSESGLAVASPMKVYLVTTAGNAIINALDTAMPLDGRSIGRKPTGSSTWFLFTDTTRNAANASQDSLASALNFNEVHFSTSNTVDWIEFHNGGDAGLSLDGLFVASRSDLADKVPLSGSIASGGVGSQNFAFPAQGGEVTLYLVNGGDTVLSARIFTRPALGDSLQAFPQGSKDWYASATASRDSANDPARSTDVVINEVMYDAPSNEGSGQYIELHNRGTAPVDLSGWSFSDGVTYTVPPGTTLAPDGYLVIAADLAYMQSAYGAIPVIGNFDGQLSNQGELIRLVDQWGNLADEVDYLPGGDWPILANGDGSSMELRNPWMQNHLPSAWADSDETNKAPFLNYSYSDTYRQLRSDGAATDHKELHLHLVGDSHVVLQNIQLRLNGTGANLLANVNQMSSNGQSAQGWLAQGTHYATYLSGNQMHLIADGHGDNRPNRVELDATAMTSGQRYEVSFAARWVAGASRLVVQTWDHSIATSIALPVPKNLGTPGARNSKFIAQPAPQIDNIAHSPPVPAAGQPVRVTAMISSPVASPQVLLYHRPDNNSGTGTWSNKPMFDNGTSGDLIAGDGTYSAILSEYAANGQIAQFYVVANGNGQSSRLPKAGPLWPAMYVIDSPSSATDLRKMRFVVSAFDLADISGQDSPTGANGYKFPRLANHYYNMTLIVNERDVIYGCEIRNSGSPWTRGGDLSRGKFKMPKDKLYRGKIKLSYDNDAGGGSRHHNRIVRHWLYLFGHPANEHEYIQVEVNNAGNAMREEVEPPANDMLDRIYENGAEGELYRIDDEWWFTDNWGRSSRNADWSYKGTDNSGRYRTEWIKRTRENEDDFSALISMFQTISANTYSQSQIERLIDPIAVMKMSAIRGYIGDWDSFSLNRGKNGYLYRRSTDGLFMFFHWDSDLAFQNTGEVFYNGMTGFRPYIEKPYNFRLYKHYLATLVEKFTRNSPRINAWLQAEEDASSQYTVSSAYQTWFSGRESAALNHLGNNRNTAFDITSNGGNTISTSGNSVNLTGTGPLRVLRVEVVGHPEAIFSWTTETAWTLSGILLHTGVNQLTLNAVDEAGNILHTDTITVNKSGNAPPVMELRADPNSWHLSVIEQLEIDASMSFDPDGLPLTFSWAANPNDAQLDASRGDEAVVTFARPGLYTFTVTGLDAGGASTPIQREAAVYAPDGFSSFNVPRLEPFWTANNVELRGNAPAGPYYSLMERSGRLILQVLDTRAFPLGSSSPAYPHITRPLPALTDWAFITKLGVRAVVYGDYHAGVMAELNEGGAVVRYGFGIEDGNALNVRRVTSSGSSTSLRSIPFDRSEAEVRIRRSGNSLFFEQRIDDVWSVVHSTGLAAGSAATQAGLFLATDTPETMKVAFDHAILVDPSATSDLRQSLRISEIMYNPVGGGDYEFVELVNIGDAPLDLTGVRFTAGIDYTFGPTILGPKQYIVVVKNQSLFASRYNTTGVNIAPGEFGGRLDNGGETIDLSDAGNILILSLTYGTSGAWPAEADGAGSSLEAKDTAGNLNDPDNWRASPEANGSPGRPGGDALGTVIVNEVLTHSDPPLEDAIEVFNRTTQPMNIGGWFLSDAQSDFKKYRIPDGTIVPAQGFHVFYENAFNDTNSPTAFSLSSANGDQVYLSAADAAGNLTGYRSVVDFGPAINGVSFGRYETSTGRDFTALTTRSFGQDAPATVEIFRTGTGLPNTMPLVGPVVINEVMYHPPDIGGTNDNVGDEYIEIYNVTSSPVPLFDPAFPTNTWHLRGGADFNLPANITLPSHGYALIVSFDPSTNAATLAAFRAKYGLPVSVPVLGPYSGKLDNSGEELKLNKPDAPQTIGPDAGLIPYVLADRVVLADNAPWPNSPDGSGDSLQRRRPHEYGNDAVNWKGAAPTPGRANVPDNDFADSDADGMLDSFEVANGFSSANPADAALDADNDGRTNYEEFLDGTNPRNDSDRLTAPMITAAPQNQSVSAGGSATFNVTASGTAPLLYQWRFNGVAIANATNASFTLGEVKPGDVGEYGVVVLNAAGFAISDGAKMSVSQPLEILAQPQNSIIDIGGSVTFSVFAVGAGDLSYQWRRDGADIPGATESGYTIASAQSSDTANYSVVVSDDNGSITSADATLSVLTPPLITQQPQSQNGVAYNDIFFSVTADGQGPFTYQWRFNGIAIPGAINSILALPNAQPSQAGTYSVEVFNPVSSTLSENALLTLQIPASITQQPQDTNVAPGTTVTLTVDATSSTPITYQWRFNDVDIPGATSSTLTLVNVQEETAGNYLVVVTDDIGSIRSQIAVVGVIIPLTFIQEPLGQAVVEGGDVTFSSEIRGGPPPFGYEWRRVSTPFASNELSVLKTFLTMTNVQPADADRYRLVVRNVTRPSGIGSALFQLTVLSDFDKDGLPDALEQALGLNTNNVADALLDLDGDGVSNRDEYLAGTDLANPESYLLIDNLHKASAATLWFQAASNMTYTVQYTDHLGSGVWQKLDDIIAYPTNSMQVVTDPDSVPHRSYRVITPRQP